MMRDAHGAAVSGADKPEYETIEVRLGTLSSRGDYCWTYRFKGRLLAKATTGRLHADDRGTEWTLYATPDGMYRVLVQCWSCWRGGSDYGYLIGQDRNMDDEAWEDRDVKGAKLTAVEVYEQAPALWKVAVRKGVVEDLPESLE